MTEQILRRIRALKETRQRLLTEQERRLAQAAAEQRDLTDEEKQADEAGHAQLEAIQDELGRYERQAKAEALAAAVADDARQAGRDAIDPKGGFGSIGEFARAVYRAVVAGEHDPRLSLQAAFPSTVGRETGSDDGYMVPAEYRQQIWEAVFDEEGLLSMIAPEPTTSNAVSILTDETTPWGSSGVQAYWAGEVTDMSSFATKLATKAELIKVHKLFAFSVASDDLVEDAPRLTDRLTRKAGMAIRWKAEEAIVNGDGAGKPLGWFKSSALVSVAKETSQAAATIVAANVTKMLSRLLTPGIRDAFWLINPDAFPQLPLMTVGQQPVYIPPTTGLTAAPGGFLLGRPVRFSDHCETLGTKGDIQLVSPSGYYAVNKTGGLTFDASMHLYFDRGAQAFRWTFRLGGQPLLSAPVSPARGSATRSYFVSLDTRS